MPVHRAGNTVEFGRASPTSDGGAKGGGVFVTSLTAFTLARSTIASNRVSFPMGFGYGGGLALEPLASFRTGLIVSSSIVGNSLNATPSASVGWQQVYGGGVYCGMSSGMSMIVRRSSISRNVITATCSNADGGSFTAPAMHTLTASITMMATNVTLNRVWVSAAKPAPPPLGPPGASPFSACPWPLGPFSCRTHHDRIRLTVILATAVPPAFCR
jgi:hypothetical protein